MGPDAPLAARWNRFHALRLAGRDRDAARCLLELAGLRGDPSPPTPQQVPSPCAPLVRYGAPRAVDRAALRQGAREVAKFEDLSREACRRLVDALTAEGLRVVTVGPYARRMDVALSTAEGPRDRYTVVASRGDRCLAVAEAERDRGPDGARRAGLALGYPPCCVARFVEVERSPEAARDGVNEATVRALVDAGPVAWELNGLSSLALVGFTPCHGRCPEALAFARRVLAAVEAERPDVVAGLRAALARPVLFLRVPLWWALEGAAPEADGALRYRLAVAQDDGSTPALTPWRDAVFGAPLAAADVVRLDAQALTLTRAGEVVVRWPLTGSATPRLVTFT